MLHSNSSYDSLLVFQIPGQHEKIFSIKDCTSTETLWLWFFFMCFIFLLFLFVKSILTGKPNHVGWRSKYNQSNKIHPLIEAVQETLPQRMLIDVTVKVKHEILEITIL